MPVACHRGRYRPARARQAPTRTSLAVGTCAHTRGRACRTRPPSAHGGVPRRASRPPGAGRPASERPVRGRAESRDAPLHDRRDRNPPHTRGDDARGRRRSILLSRARTLRRIDADDLLRPIRPRQSRLRVLHGRALRRDQGQRCGSTGLGPYADPEPAAVLSMVPRHRRRGAVQDDGLQPARPISDDRGSAPRVGGGLEGVSGVAGGADPQARIPFSRARAERSRKKRAARPRPGRLPAAVGRDRPSAVGGGDGGGPLPSTRAAPFG